MSLVLFVFASVVGYLLYASFKRDLQKTQDAPGTPSSDGNDACPIIGCRCEGERGFFHALIKSFNAIFEKDHALVHAKPSALQFHSFGDRFKTLEDVTEAIREAGLNQCRLVLGIDFTASNEFQGRSTNGGRSLHYLSSSFTSRAMNPYLRVIRILSRTLPKLMVPQNTDSSADEWSFAQEKSSDLCIHAYGFGDTTTKDKGVFPLHNTYVACSSFAELEKSYKDVLSWVTLDGPTSFAPVINQAIEVVKEEKNNFHILIIIADGQFVDEGPTAEAIVNASNHPLGIVVVGVGDGPWDMLMRFDDWLPQRRFDNFQFVDCNKVIRDFGSKHYDTALALHTLMEIPDQFKAVQRLGYLEIPPTLNSSRESVDEMVPEQQVDFDKRSCEPIITE